MLDKIHFKLNFAKNGYNKFEKTTNNRPQFPNEPQFSIKFSINYYNMKEN